MNEFINRDKRAPGNDGGGRHGLKNRYKEQVNGRCGPGTDSWKNHDDQYRGLWNKLKNYERRFREHPDGCGDVPSEVTEWVNTPPPTDDDWSGDRNAPPQPECNKQLTPKPVPLAKPQQSQESEKQGERSSDSGPWVDPETVAKTAKVAGAVVVVAGIVALAVVAAPVEAVAGAAALVVVGLGALFGSGGSSSSGDGA